MVETKILVTGAGGLLGRCLVDVLSSKYSVRGTTRQDCDITNKKMIEKAFASERPQIVVHTAALTDVDACEDNPELAVEVNVNGTRNIAEASNRQGAILIFMSTDYVFDGDKDSPYRETDQPNPINVYARSKFDAEDICLSAAGRNLVIRSGWLFGSKHRDFVDIVITKIREGKDFGMIRDKYSIPTYNVDLSIAVSDLITRLLEGHSEDSSGIYHITNSGRCSWYEFALKIQEFLGKGNANIYPITLDEYNFSAKRPMFTVLENRRFFELLGYRLRPWGSALEEYIERCYRS